ncbi:tubulin folding cofactor D C terminal-domain-containing protein [Macrophomina phaseolina]|uniref:Tubulin folding cofactor D C terminal-domain-containing protein n=1 Tax=Macrophomina phaseolina TaxID=35725 RepID=A0ABQ8GSH8_9PEZI|nr:tubulin folding cofactor D C terminal-domain-containing protein [Macrophomina phaseolina]
MDAADDEDIRLQRASAGLLSDLRLSLDKVLWKSASAFQGQRRVHRLVRQSDLNRLLSFIEPFQEEPQLIDAHLKYVVPRLVSAYLEYLPQASAVALKTKTVTLSHAVSRVLYTLCKVRGQKVIVGFLSNEPRYLEPILDHFEKGLSDGSLVWEEKYVALLWLSHLMLAPFDLASISSHQPPKTAQQRTYIALPDSLPGVVNRIVPVCIDHLKCATRERDASASLLVRLSLRPDMRKLGLLDHLVRWALSFFGNASENLSDIHSCLGILSFLSGLVASANKDELGVFLTDIYKACNSIIYQENLEFVKSSAVARKLVIKTFRNVVLHYLQSEPSDDSSAILEDVIDFLLQTMGDGDSPVRYAASKALSVIAMKLEAELGAEVIEAILGCLNEDVLWDGSSRNLVAVDSLRWHGLTLALSQLLYRRAPSTEQLPDVLNALLLAITFEQRTATGGSIGTNVRDAACFGIWALSRRYTTSELLSVSTTSIRAAGIHDQALSVPQILAIELLAAACLDPAGNIRRGSSAALQELIGRHPNTVLEGISLVQIVDFHAVGLRDRAISQVGFRAAQLGQIYWDHLFDALLGWRGVGSLDASSRISTANATGLLSTLQPFQIVRIMLDRIRRQLCNLNVRDVEERHGLILSLSSLITESDRRYPGGNSGATPFVKEEVAEVAGLWTLFDGQLDLPERAFTSPALRPELTACSVCALISALAGLTNRLGENISFLPVPFTKVLAMAPLRLCLSRTEESVLRLIPSAVVNVSLLSNAADRKEELDAWLSHLNSANVRTALRDSGFAIAVGAMYSTLDDAADRTRIIELLVSRCTNIVEIEARVVALQSLQLVFESASQAADVSLSSKIADALLTTLNDYTINERGDVGSLVRLEALNATDSAWKHGILAGLDQESYVYADVTRLSLEKLDKVRLRAAACLQHNGKGYFGNEFELDASGTSSQEYFARAIQHLDANSYRVTRLAILEGYVSSAGMGSESVVQAARLALVGRLQALPTENDDFSLLHVANSLVDVFKVQLTNDRVVLPLLEVLAFLLDMQVLQRLDGSSFKWRNLLSLVQKAHFKSNNMQKLVLALDVYRGLADIPAVGSEVRTKLVSMLLHPFPKIRVATAETLFLISANEDLKVHDWSQPSKNLKGVVDRIKELIA